MEVTDKQRPAHWLAVDSLDIDSQGVARRADGKVVFIDGALPGEWVSANVHRTKNNWEQASLVEVHEQSAQRVRCALARSSCAESASPSKAAVSKLCACAHSSFFNCVVRACRLKIRQVNMSRF